MRSGHVLIILLCILGSEDLLNSLNCVQIFYKQHCVGFRQKILF